MKKILIWGTGKNAKKVLRNGINAKLLGFVETNKAMEEFEGHPVYGINEIPKGYDYIVIASIYAGEIYRECEKRNFDPDKIIFSVWSEDSSRSERFCDHSGYIG